MSKRSRAFLYRSKMDIIANILENAMKGMNKTKLMYSCNLSFKHFNSYLEFLLDRRLLEITDKGRTILIKTTSKGTDFLRLYRKIEKLINV